MARDRIVYRFAWLVGVVSPLLAALVGALYFSSALAILQVGLVGIGLSAVALAGHLRLRILMADLKRNVAAVRLKSVPAPATAALGVGTPEMRQDLAAIEERLVELERAHDRSLHQVLAAVQQGPGSDAMRLHGLLQRRAVAVVASDALIAALPPDVEVHRLFPSSVAGTMASSGADTIIIEEQALASGVWRSALQPEGAGLFGELRSAMFPVAGARPQVYVITLTGMAGVAAKGLREGAVIIDDSFRAPSGAEAALLTSLIAYRAAT